MTGPTQAHLIEATSFTGLNRDELDSIVDALQEENQIGTFRDRPKAYRRYVHVRSQELFDRLSELYADLFTSNWSAFKHAYITEPTGREDANSISTKASFMAQCYLTAWFWDTQYCIRESVRKLSGTAYNQHFTEDLNLISPKYDPFLQHLNMVIRPTLIHQSTEDTLYIPLLGQTFNYNEDAYNFLNLQGCGTEIRQVYAITDVMDSRRTEWSTIPLATNVLGRASWLLDFKQGNAYAWFPFESNFTELDLVAPYILGIPCTPRLGPRDEDHYQHWTHNDPPLSTDGNIILNPLAYVRSSERKFFGNAEYRTMEYNSYTQNFEAYMPRVTTSTQAKNKRKKDAAPEQLSTGQGDGSSSSKDAEMSTEESEAPPPPKIPRPRQIHQFRLIDWVYHSRVILGADKAMQRRALWDFIHAGATPSHQDRKSVV